MNQFHPGHREVIQRKKVDRTVPTLFWAFDDSSTLYLYQTDGSLQTATSLCSSTDRDLRSQLSKIKSMQLQVFFLTYLYFLDPDFQILALSYYVI